MLKIKSKKKKKTLSGPERQERHKKKLEKFGIKKIGFLASNSEREFIRQCITKAGCSSRQEFIIEAIIAHGSSFGLSMAEVNKELKKRELNGT